MRKNWIKIAGSLCLIAVLVVFFPVQQAGQVLQKIRLSFIPVCLVIGFIWYAIFSLRMKLLLSAFTGKALPFGRVYRDCLYSMAFGYWLPSSFGTDAILVLTHKKWAGVQEAFFAVSMNRLIGIAALLALALFGAYFLDVSLLQWLLKIVLLGMTILTAILLVLYMARKKKAASDFLNQLLKVLIREPFLVLNVFVLSVINLLAGVVGLYVLMRAFGLTVSFLTCSVLLPYWQSLLLVPVSFAGIGLQDISFVTFFSKYGELSASQALAVSIMLHIFNLFFVGFSYLLYGLEHSHQSLRRD